MVKNLIAFSPLNVPSATIPNEPNGVLRCPAFLNIGFQKSQLIKGAEFN